MRALIALCLVLSYPFIAYAALTTGQTGGVSGEIKIPVDVKVDPSYLSPNQMLNIPGASGGLTNPACVAETSARAARDQPPPKGDFPCTPIPASNGSGFVYGVCFANVCKGTSFSLVGAITSFLSNIPLSSIASAILGKIMGSGQGDSSGGAGDIGTPVPQTPLASQLISTDSTEPLDTSLMLAQSDKIVEDLNSALNPPGTQVPI